MTNLSELIERVEADSIAAAIRSGQHYGKASS